MAEETQAKQPRRRKGSETVRERGDKHAAKTNAPKKPSKLKGKIVKPFNTIKSTTGKLYKPIPVPDNKVGRVLGKKVHFIPPYFVNAWRELKLVTWPTPREAARLTMAVVIFAITFAIIVQFLDIGFSKLVKEILLK